MAKVDEIPLKGIHHVEFWVGNAKQADFYYRKAFGFSRIAYAGPETGVRDRASYVLAQGKVRLVFTTPLFPEGEIADHIRQHGDGVHDIAFEVEDAAGAYETAVSRGAASLCEPAESSDTAGTVKQAAVHTYGDTVHSLVERNGYDGVFLPGFEVDSLPGTDVGLLKIDHIVGNVELSKMDTWADYYENVFGWKRFKHFDENDISTEFTALQSVVMSNADGSIKFPINEPAPGKRKSQIEEYLDFYTGPGVQHIAMLTGDILASVRQLRDNGVDFLFVPDTYYDDLADRVGEIREPMAPIKDLGILVDRDDDGYLLQLFTKPLEDRPTLFIEIIQRRGSQSFGKGNFKALFESIEREQERRGNL